jgi:hypothetical protein
LTCSRCIIPWNTFGVFGLTVAVETESVSALFVKLQYSESGEDIELAGYLANVSGPVSLVMDLRIAHERWGSNSDPSIYGHLHYPNDIDRSLSESVNDKIRKYRSDYNDFLEFQEFNFRNQTVDSSSTAAQRSPPTSNPRLGTFSLRFQHSGSH